MRHFSAILIYILKNRGKNKFALTFAYAKIIFSAYFYHKVQKYFSRQQPEFLSINLMGLKIKFFNYPALLHLFEEIFIYEIYQFETSASTPAIIDCGSNIGLSVLYFKTKFPESTVLAFEPDENNFNLLKKNIEDNQLKDVTIKKIALANEKSERPLFITDREAGSVNNSLMPSSIHIASIKVQTDRLSDFVLERVDWLKVDTEGSEGEIIRDICYTEKIKLIDKLFIEYHQQCEIPLPDLEKLLDGYNFKRMNLYTTLSNSQYLLFRKAEG